MAEACSVSLFELYQREETSSRQDDVRSAISASIDVIADNGTGSLYGDVGPGFRN